MAASQVQLARTTRTHTQTHTNTNTLTYTPPVMHAQLTGPLLDALDAEYATPCEATAFLALQVRARVGDKHVRAWGRAQ